MSRLSALLLMAILSPSVGQQLSPDPALQFPVNTTAGLVYGAKNITVSGTSYYYFTGIHYATATRFQDPQPITRRDYSRVPASQPARCPEWDSEANRVRGREEGCLHLSVFTRQAPGTPTFGFERWPVVVLVSGSRFLAAPDLDPDFLLDKGTLVVTVSYRVGALGFLSTGDSHVPGNYGLLDLEMALEWIQRNIEAFGGNRLRVTLMGHGAGAALVSYLLLNPRITDANLVSGAVTMSGSALCPWASPLEYPMNQTRSLAAALGCERDDTKEMIDCLHGQPFQRIVKQQHELHMMAPWNLPPVVAPVIDEGLRSRPAVPLEPMEALQRGNGTKTIPLVSGVVTDEAALMFADSYSRQSVKHIVEEGEPQLPTAIIEQLLFDAVTRVARFCNHADEIVALIRYYYFRNVNADDTENLARATIQVMTDLLYNECQLKWAQLYHEKSGADVYSYVFSYKGRISTLDSTIAQSTLNISDPVITALRRSVAHGDDAQYVFNRQLMPLEDREVQDELARICGEFVRTGSNPRPGWNSKQGYADYTNYLRIDRATREERHYRDDAMAFLRYVMALSKTPEGPTGSRHHGAYEPYAPPYELIMWILVGIAIFLFIAFVLTAILFVRQKKKTTFVTR